MRKTTNSLVQSLSIVPSRRADVARARYSALMLADVLVVAMKGLDAPGVCCGRGADCTILSSTFKPSAIALPRPNLATCECGYAIDVRRGGAAWLQVRLRPATAPHPPPARGSQHLHHGAGLLCTAWGCFRRINSTLGAAAVAAECTTQAPQSRAVLVSLSPVLK